MAEESLVSLTKEMRQAGWVFYERLKRSGITLNAVFWAVYYSKGWRLIISTPDVDNRLKDPHRVAIELLPDMLVEDSTDEFLYFHMIILGVNDRIVRGARDWARRRFGTEDGSVDDDPGIRRQTTLTQNDAYIYYLAPEK